MKKLLIKLIVAFAAFGYVLSTPIQAQEKKVHVKKVMVEVGEKKVVDTVFTVKEGENEKEIMQTFIWTTDDDKSGEYTFDVQVDIDEESDGEKKVIVIKSNDDATFFTDKGKEHKVKIVGDGDEKQIFVFKGDDGEEIEQEVIVKVINLGDSLKEMEIKLEQEMIILEEELAKLEENIDLKDLESLKVLAELDEIKKIKDIEIIMPDIDHEHDFVWFESHTGNSEPTEKEIRDVGINVKMNRLDLKNYNIDIHNGVVDVEFSITGEASPKVTIYNFYGDKVTSVKPELMNGNYSFKVDMSNKHHGTYYIHIVSKDSSITKKFKI